MDFMDYDNTTGEVSIYTNDNNTAGDYSMIASYNYGDYGFATYFYISIYEFDWCTINTIYPTTIND